MDTLTHALSGALLARATAPKDLQPGMLPRRIAAGFLTAAAPDLDFVAGFFGDLQYLMHHRGISHSVLMLPLWALLLSWLLSKILRAPGGWRSLYGICAMGVGAHIAGDVITSYGTMVTCYSLLGLALLFAIVWHWRDCLWRLDATANKR